MRTIPAMIRNKSAGKPGKDGVAKEPRVSAKGPKGAETAAKGVIAVAPPSFRRERALIKRGIWPVAGCDEAGRGPLAGPVVAAAVILDPNRIPRGIDDSKRLTAEEREKLFDKICATAQVSVAVASPSRIDRDNILRASLWALKRAVVALPEAPRHVFVDGRDRLDTACDCEAVIGGDGIVLSIAAASIVAKTHRDRLMDELAREYPLYGFERHKGYSTPEHQAAIAAHGPCAIHRRSFTFIRELCGEYSALFYDLKGRLDAAAAHADLQALDDELAACMGALAEHEQRKLKLVLSRRWKAL